MGCDRRIWPHHEARVRHQRGHVDESRRQPRRHADRLRPARRHLRHAHCGHGVGIRHAYRRRPGLRDAAALQPRRQAHRVLVRSRRPLEHLDDGRRREEPAAAVARPPVVREQSHVVARRPVRLRAPSLRRRALARRRRDLDVPLVGSVRRPAGDREDRLPERQRRAGDLTRRALPLLQQGRHPRAELRIQQGSERHHLRDHAARPRHRPRAPRGERAGRLGRPADLARRQDARLHPASAPPELPVSARSRERPRPAGVRQHRQGSAGSLGGPRALSPVRMDAGRQVDRHLGRGKDLARGHGVGQGSADPVHGARRADDHRGGPLPAESASR